MIMLVMININDCFLIFSFCIVVFDPHNVVYYYLTLILFFSQIAINENEGFKYK